LLIIENAESDDLSAQPFDVFLRVRPFDGHEDNQTALKRGFDLTTDAD
jgi:hypothetical protein